MIVFKTVKCISRAGTLGYKIKEIKALNREELPKEYLERIPNCIKVVAGLRINTALDTNVLRMEAFYSRAEMAKIINKCKVCGNRLQKINRKILEESWCGTETIKI